MLFQAPSVTSSGRPFLTGLQAKSVSVDIFGVGLRFPSMRGRAGEKKEGKKKALGEVKKKKTLTLPAHLEAMYARPVKGSALQKASPGSLPPLLPPYSLAPPSQGEKARCVTPSSPENSYMSVGARGRGPGASGLRSVARAAWKRPGVKR